MKSLLSMMFFYFFSFGLVLAEKSVENPPKEKNWEAIKTQYEQAIKTGKRILLEEEDPALVRALGKGDYTSDAIIMAIETSLEGLDGFEAKMEMVLLRVRGAKLYREWRDHHLYFYFLRYDKKIQEEPHDINRKNYWRKALNDLDPVLYWEEVKIPLDAAIYELEGLPGTGMSKSGYRTQCRSLMGGVKQDRGLYQYSGYKRPFFRPDLDGCFAAE